MSPPTSPAVIEFISSLAGRYEDLQDSHTISGESSFSYAILFTLCIVLWRVWTRGIVKFRGFRVFESIHIIHASYEVTTLRSWEKLEPGLEPARDF